MKKSILRMATVAAAAALFCVGVGCNDSGVDENARNQGLVDKFLDEFNGKPDDNKPTTQPDDTSGGSAANTRYTLTVNANPPSGGDVTRAPNDATYKSGDIVTVTATANKDYTFISWSGAINARTRSVKITMNGNLTLNANFSKSDEVEADTVAPTIQLNAPPSPNDVILGLPFNDPGASASDGYGDVLNYITLITNSAGDTVQSVNTSAVNTFYVTYSVCKTLRYASGKMADTCAHAQRTVNIIEPPAVLPTYTLTTGSKPPEGGGVTRNPNKAIYTAGDTVTITATAVPGFTFDQWTGTEAHESMNNTITRIMSRDLTLTANFVITVTFNASGGSVTPASGTTDTSGKLASLPTPEKDGHTFDGWYTAETGGEQVTTSTVFIANATIYARWVAGIVPTYTITFNANGGTVTPDSGTTDASGTITSLPEPTKDGYTFKGWFTAETGGEEITVNRVFRENATIYAQWEKKVTDNIADKTFAVLKGSSFENVAKNIIGATNIIYKNTLEDAVEAVKNGEADATLAEEYVARKFAAHNEELTVHYPPVIEKNYHAIFNGKDSTLRDEFNAFLDTIRSNGVYDDMITRWIDSPEPPEMPEIQSDESKTSLTFLTSEDNPPFSSFKAANGLYYQGFDIELAERFAQACNYDLHNKNITWKNSTTDIIWEIRSNQNHFASNLITITDEIKNVVIFSEPIYHGGTVVLSKKKK